jgi:outer membrane protein assembly factor BamD
MEKSDRDPMHAFRAEDECRQLVVQFPNSKFAPEAQQKLRNIQEVLADHEFKAGYFYHTKGSFPAAANRLQGVADQFPLYSGSDEALWELADSYQKMGDRFDDKKAAALARIVKDYPLSSHVDEAKDELKAMKRPVPDADPVAYARMKYELENREKAGIMSHVWGAFKKNPDTRLAAKSGSPQMETMHPTVPASVPVTAPASTGGFGEVGVSTVTDKSALDSLPDARGTPPATAAPGAPAAPAPTGSVTATPGTAPQSPSGGAPTASDPATNPSAPPAASAAPQQLPTNHPMPVTKGKKKKDKKKKGPEVQSDASSTGKTDASTTGKTDAKQPNQ